MNSKQREKRWCLKFKDYLCTATTYWKRGSAIEGYAKDMFKPERLLEICKELDIDMIDLSHAIWRRAKRDGNTIVKVEIREL